MFLNNLTNQVRLRWLAEKALRITHAPPGSAVFHLSGPGPLASNSVDALEQVRIRQVDLPARRGASLQAAWPPASVMVMTLGS